MIDPRYEAILIRPKQGGEYQDKTRDVLYYQIQGSDTDVTFARDRDHSYSYKPDRILILRRPKKVRLDSEAQVTVRGEVWRHATEVLRFRGSGRVWLRVFYQRKNGETYRTYPAGEVQIVRDVTRTGRGAEIMKYWAEIVRALSPKDPLWEPFQALKTVRSDSVLGRYLMAEPIGVNKDDRVPLFPFSSNLSQREAVRKALRYPISVIEGPPGTGKTQTILNLLVTLVAIPGASVGVVSLSNTAVDNVYEKMTREGFGYVIARLGNKEKCDQFFKAQVDRNPEVEALLANSGRQTESVWEIADAVARLDRRLARLQERERRLARLRQESDAYHLEREHLARLLDRQQVPELQNDLPLLRRPSRRILDYLAETESPREHTTRFTRWLANVRRYARYGPLAEIDPGDSDTVIRLHEAYYDQKIGELDQEIGALERALRTAGFTELLEEHHSLSVQALRAGLRQRYKRLGRRTYDWQTYRSPINRFLTDYPVILSTCHSLGRNLGRDYLLDYLVIDESSQVDLLTACIALAYCRNVVVVGDPKQIGHIADDAAADAASCPAPEYDYRKHSLLSSLSELYGDRLPRTMLREHYRCDPEIIGFCNEKFYDGELIPLTRSTPGSDPLVVVPTVEGNHMREHLGGGRSNQREIDVITQEVIPRYCAGIAREDIGVTTPYRRQADKLANIIDHIFDDGIEADTVHKYQGREKKVVIMTTVLGDTWRGRTGIPFVDDPHLVNVAVSRAVEKFVLVTNHEMLPTSHNLRDLMGYIAYHHPDQEVVESEVVSVFDLLYQDYSARLRPFAARLLHKMRYRSEDIIWTLLREILAEERYAGLRAVDHVLLQTLLPNLTGLTPAQEAFVRHRSSVDIVVFNGVTRKPLQAIEVDGFKYHENNPKQRERDTLKDDICADHGLPLLRLSTTGSDEGRLIREALDAALSAADEGQQLLVDDVGDGVTEAM
ncbi:MAG TPA: AAA domain-containing protein [Pseudonocardiaceae bacterium]